MAMSTATLQLRAAAADLNPKHPTCAARLTRRDRQTHTALEPRLQSDLQSDLAKSCALLVSLRLKSELAVTCARVLQAEKVSGASSSNEDESEDEGESEDDLSEAASEQGGIIMAAVAALHPSQVRSFEAVDARPRAAVPAGRGHGVAATRKDGTRALLGVRWLIMHVELKVSAPFECGALHCASGAVHRAIAHTHGSDSFCGRWLIPGPQATSHSAAAAGPYQLTSRELRGLRGDHQHEEACSACHRERATVTVT